MRFQAFHVCDVCHVCHRWHSSDVFPRCASHSFPCLTYRSNLSYYHSIRLRSYLMLSLHHKQSNTFSGIFSEHKRHHFLNEIQNSLKFWSILSQMLSLIIFSENSGLLVQDWALNNISFKRSDMRSVIRWRTTNAYKVCVKGTEKRPQLMPTNDSPLLSSPKPFKKEFLQQLSAISGFHWRH